MAKAIDEAYGLGVHAIAVVHDDENGLTGTVSKLAPGPTITILQAGIDCKQAEQAPKEEPNVDPVQDQR